MNWEAIAAIGELVSAAAVVVSLIYLARQVSMGNRLARSEAWRSRAAEVSNLNAAFGVNPVFDRAMTKVYQGKVSKDMDADEISLVNSFCVSMVLIYDQMWNEISSGVLDKRATEEFIGIKLFRLAYFKENWGAFKQILRPQQISFMEEKFGLLAPVAEQN